MADRKKNKVEQKIESEGNCAFLYPKACFIWFMGGSTTDPALESQMLYRITRDMETLQRMCQQKGLQPVALLTGTTAAPLVARLLPQFHRWGLVELGPEALDVDNLLHVCAATAGLVMSYGNPSDEVHNALAELDHPPTLIQRDIRMPGRETQKLMQQQDPYAEYRAEAERLRSWQPMPFRGLQIRQQLDLRPKFTL